MSEMKSETSVFLCLHQCSDILYCLDNPVILPSQTMPRQKYHSAYDLKDAKLIILHRLGSFLLIANYTRVHENA